MKRFLFTLLLTVGMMVVAAPVLRAQDNIDFRSKKSGKVYPYSLERVVDITTNSELLIEGTFADLVADFYNCVFRSKGPNELAVEFLASRESNEILAIQWTAEGKIQSFRMWTPEFGWLQATRDAVQILETRISSSH